MTRINRDNLTPAARLDYDAAFYLGRVTGATVSDRTSESLRRVLESLDFDSYQRIRSIRTYWPAFAGKGNPRKARWSQARAGIERGLRADITSAWSSVLRYAHDASSGLTPGCIYEIARAIREIVYDAWEHGAITKEMQRDLQATNSANRELAISYETPKVRAYYVNGYRVASTWDEARAKLAEYLGMSESEVTMSHVWDRYVHQREEWKNHSGHASNVPITSVILHDNGSVLVAPYVWVPVRNPVCSVDRERSMAAWFVCCAFASVNARSAIPAYRAAQMSEQYGARAAV